MLDNLREKIKNASSVQEAIAILEIMRINKNSLDYLKNGSLLEVLENIPVDLAEEYIKEMIDNYFEDWEKNPSFEFPIAVLSKEKSELLEASSCIARFSAETMIKQKKHHPELTIEDYKKVQETVSAGEVIKEDDYNLIFILNNLKGAVCVIKATRNGKKLYLTSFRLLSSDKVKRDEEILRLLKKKTNGRAPQSTYSGNST